MKEVNGITFRMVVILLLLILFTACESDPGYVCFDGSKAADFTKCPIQISNREEIALANNTEVQPEMDVPAAPTLKEARKPYDLTNLSRRAQEKINSLSFVISEKDQEMHYSARGDIMKVNIENMNSTMTHIYLNTSSKEAYGYCLGCGKQNRTIVDYDQYYVNTPYQWIMAIEEAYYLENGPLYNKKSTIKISFTSNKGEMGVMNIIEFYGVPAKITFEDGTNIEYKNLMFNTVSAEDMIFPEDLS